MQQQERLSHERWLERREHEGLEPPPAEGLQERLRRAGGWDVEKPLAFSNTTPADAAALTFMSTYRRGLDIERTLRLQDDVCRLQDKIFETRDQARYQVTSGFGSAAATLLPQPDQTLTAAELKAAGFIMGSRTPEKAPEDKLIVPSLREGLKMRTPQQMGTPRQTLPERSSSGSPRLAQPLPYAGSSASPRQGPGQVALPVGSLARSAAEAPDGPLAWSQASSAPAFCNSAPKPSDGPCRRADMRSYNPQHLFAPALDAGCSTGRSTTPPRRPLPARRTPKLQPPEEKNSALADVTFGLRAGLVQAKQILQEDGCSVSL
eukprot:TRINITY_DN8949_c0_g1_i8.p1 TRINITY_DN8949_c0_g1~~TRINITY_DN8949_c0_g1_i8.p1  ORF type:complete len:320 (+),score=73.57 TRINITY_DN8949_c0_g1_i8:104-1063(+)